MPKENRGPHLHWRKDRKQWIIRWFESGRERKKATGFGRGERLAAEAALGKHLLEIEPKQEGPSRASERIIDDVVAAYGTERAPHTKNKDRIAYAIRALLAFWTERPVSDITETTCREYLLSRSVSAGTVIRELGVLKAALQWDVDHNRLERAPKIWMPRRPPPKDRWLTRSEAARLIRGARNEELPEDAPEGTPARLMARSQRRHLCLFLLLGLYTGARKEAILSLRWAQVDLDARRIDFNPPGRERTSKGRPIIRVPDRLMTFLRYAKREGSDTGYVITYGGKPVANVKKAFARACRKAVLERVTPHTLRHTVASWARQSGVPFEDIADYLGHEDLRTTARIYAHMSPDFQGAMVAALDRRRGG